LVRTPLVMGFTFIANGFPILIYLSSDFCPDPLCSSYTCNTHAWPRAVLVLYGDYSGSRHARPITYRQAAVLVIGREPMHFHASQQAQAGQGPRAPHIVLARTRRGQLAFQVGAGGEGDMRHAAAHVWAPKEKRKPMAASGEAGARGRGVAWVAFTSSVDRQFHWPTRQPASSSLSALVVSGRCMHPPFDSAVVSIPQLCIPATATVAVAWRALAVVPIGRCRHPSIDACMLGPAGGGGIVSCVCRHREMRPAGEHYLR
jgi:hypothetical protein